MPMPEPVRYRSKGFQSGTGMLRFRTEIQVAGMPMPTASTSMPMPSYGHVTNLEHHGGACSQNVEDGPQGNVEAEYGVPVPPRLPPATRF
jgi:hypothetical protein